MSRYVNDVSVVKSPEEADAMITQFMASKGFKLKKHEGGVKLWQKGDGWVAAPQFISTAAHAGSVRIEAWIKYAWLPGVYSGEMGLTGFFGFAIKAMLKSTVQALENELKG